MSPGPLPPVGPPTGPRWDLPPVGAPTGPRWDLPPPRRRARWPWIVVAGFVAVGLLAFGAALVVFLAAGEGSGPAADGDVPVSEVASEPPPKGSAGVPGCTQSELGAEPRIRFTSAARIRDGQLVGPCLGALDPVLDEAWQLLEAVAPSEDLADLVVLSGYRSTEPADEVTLAFVHARGAGDRFHMALNLEEARRDPAEFRLTVVHEFAHVLAGRADQVARSARRSECPTFDSGAGCLHEDAWLARWVARFWTDRADDFGPFDEADPVSGDRACRLDPGYLGSYAASHPEEDFAETFSAFVLRVEVGPDVQAKVDFFAEDPHLSGYRDRAVAAGLGPVRNGFDGCG